MFGTKGQILKNFCHKMLKKIIENANKNLVINKDDFKGEHGLYVCGTCKKPKQLLVDGLKAYTPCDCDAENFEKHKKNLHVEDANKMIEKNRLYAFPYPNMRNINFEESNDQSLQVSAFIDYAESFGDKIKSGLGLLITGASGTGKTYYSVCIANKIIDNGFTVKFLDIDSIARYELDMGELHEVLDSFDLVVIDNFGFSEYDRTRSELCESIISHRYQARKSMIVNSNVDIYEMIKNTDEETVEFITFEKIFELCTPIILRTKKRKSLENINIIDDNPKSKLYKKIEEWR